MRIFQFLLVAFMFSACNWSFKWSHSQQSETLYRVVGVKDGDTFVVLMDGIEQTVRFNHIDCPEKKQPFGTKAKQYVADQCFNQYVRLIHDEKYDRYNRLLAEIVLPDGRNLNKELVANGLAWHFKKYSSDIEYDALEQDARKRQINIWSDANPIPPWEWRKPIKK